MFNSLLSVLTKDSGPLGALLALFIISTVWLGKALLKEKDDEIRDQRNDKEKFTLVLGEIDHTLEAILVDLRFHHSAEQQPEEKK